jgi:hypothetical protein
MRAASAQSSDSSMVELSAKLLGQSVYLVSQSVIQNVIATGPCALSAAYQPSKFVSYLGFVALTPFDNLNW